jgi:biopolymer transport protein ExbB
MVEATLAYLRQGGWVMLPMVAVCAVMWTLILERWQVLRGLSRSDLGVTAALKAVHGEEVSVTGEGLRARLVQAFLDRRSGRSVLDRQILAQCERDLDRDLENHLEAIAVLAVVAPLLGLLGTVLGMIETFQVIADFGTGNARALAGGISVALVTTQTGLLVAIPGLLLSSRMRDHAEQLRLRLAETTRMLDREIGHRPATTAGGG